MSHVYKYSVISILAVFHTLFPAGQPSAGKLHELQRLVRPVDTVRIDASVNITSDSAFFKLPLSRETLGASSAFVHLVTRCSADSVHIYVRHSYSRCDTIARLHRPPYCTDWNFSGIPDQDQIHLQFGYRIFQSGGKTVISWPLPHQWVIDRTMKKSRRTYHCRQMVRPDTVVIDGKLDEWKHVRRGRIGAHGLFALRWSNTMLYFAAEVKSGEIGPADIVELHLDPCRTRSSFASEVHRSIRFGPLSRSYCFVSCNIGNVYRQCDSIASLLLDGMKWSVSISDTGYIIETALPFYALSSLDFPKLRQGLDVTIRSGGSPVQFHAWANSREYNRYNPSEWGTLVLHQAMLPIRIAMVFGILITALVSIIIAFVVIRHFFLTERYEREEAKGGSKALQAIEKSVRARLGDQKLTIEQAAAEAGLSADEVVRTLRDELDCTFERFLCFRRINAAKELLWNFNLPIDTVAQRCGFSSANEMTLRFMEYLNTDPASFRERNREAAFDEDGLAGPGTSGQ